MVDELEREEAERVGRVEEEEEEAIQAEKERAPFFKKKEVGERERDRE